MDKYAVIGNPIAHSLSPKIHQLFAEQTQQQINYEKILVPLDSLKTFIDDFQNFGGQGLNITLPFKQEAYHLVNQYSEQAQQAGAINTIKFNTDGSRFGDNTDGVGLITDLINNYHFSIQHKTILILGAGGAVQGALFSLLQQMPKKIIIANRTVNKAIALAKKYSSYPIQACSFTELNNEDFDLIINATSASLDNNSLSLPHSILTKNTFCYDMMYGKNLTPFLIWAKNLGIKNYADGLGMLVEQAAISFFVWRGVKPETKNILKTLRAENNS